MRVAPAVALLLCASSLFAQTSPRPKWLHTVDPKAAREQSEKLVTAWLAKDEKTPDELAAATRPDPFLVANELFGAFARGERGKLDTSGANLDLADDFARRAQANPAAKGLGTLVAKWRALDAGALEREAKLQALLADVVATRKTKDRSASIAQVTNAADEIANATASLTAVELRLEAGDALLKREAFDESVHALEAARAGAIALGWPGGEEEACVQLGGALARRAEYRAAQGPWARAAELAAERGERALAADLTRRLANLSGHLGEGAPALELAKKALAEFEALGDRAGVAEALGDAGTASDTLFRYEDARTFQSRALAILETLDDRKDTAIARANLARAHLFLCEYEPALSLSEQAVREFEAIDFPYGLAMARMILAAVQCDLRDWKSAQSQYELAVATLEKLGQRSDMTAGVAGLADCAAQLGDHDRALELYQRALELKREFHLRAEAANTLAAIGDLHKVRGELDLAKECLTQALGEQEAMGDRRSVARTRTRLSAALEAANDLPGALDVERQALAEKEELNDSLGLVTSLRRIAGMLSATSHAAESIEFARRSVAEATRLGEGLGEQGAAGLRGDARESALTGLRAAGIALSRKEPTVDRAALLGDALWCVESSRALLLADVLQNRSALLTASLPAELRNAERDARASVALRQRSLSGFAARGSAAAADLARAKKELDDAYRALEAVIGRIQREERRVASVRYPEPIGLDALRAVLPADAALLMYSCRFDRTFLLVVTRESIDLLNVGKSDELIAQAKHLIELAATPGGDDAPLAAKLYEELLRPVEANLGACSRLIVSPDESLALLPFEALLRVEGEKRSRVLERFEISYVPSGTVLAELARESAGVARGSGVVALGDPLYPGEEVVAGGSAPAAEAATAMPRELARRGLGSLARLAASGEEARAIVALAPAERRVLLLRDAATKEGLAAALAGVKGRLAAVHLACHGHVDSDHPRLTGLVLAHGEFLSLDDVLGMSVSADLAVLSACETGRGSVQQGEGVFGLVRAFFFAGTPRVVVTNWSIADETTRALMVRFYEGMWRERRSAAAALRQAKLEVLARGGAAAHPSHWAGFVLWGLRD